MIHSVSRQEGLDVRLREDNIIFAPSVFGYKGHGILLEPSLS
jgi:hypothetical protein